MVGFGGANAELPTCTEYCDGVTQTDKASSTLLPLVGMHVDADCTGDMDYLVLEE